MKNAETIRKKASSVIQIFWEKLNVTTDEWVSFPFYLYIYFVLSYSSSCLIPSIQPHSQAPQIGSVMWAARQVASIPVEANTESKNLSYFFLSRLSLSLQK
jgi:hypothetical protein